MDDTYVPAVRERDGSLAILVKGDEASCRSLASSHPDAQVLTRRQALELWMKQDHDTPPMKGW